MQAVQHLTGGQIAASPTFLPTRLTYFVICVQRAHRRRPLVETSVGQPAG